MAAPKKPRSVSALHQLIDKVATAEGTAPNRLQRRISAMVLAAAFDRARTVDDDRLFAVKGGVTIELRLGLRARSSQDFDVSYAVQLDELLVQVDAVLGEPVGEFSFERVTEEPYVNGEHGFMSAEVRINYCGKSFRKIKLELMRAEGRSTERLEFVPAFGATKNACLDVFTSRDRHPWPPTIRVEPGWPEQFRQEADEIGFPATDVRAAAERVQEIVDEIDQSA